MNVWHMLDMTYALMTLIPDIHIPPIRLAELLHIARGQALIYLIRSAYMLSRTQCVGACDICR